MTNDEKCYDEILLTPDINAGGAFLTTDRISIDLTVPGTSPIPTQTVSTSARHGVPRKSPSMMAAAWSSKIHDAARPTPIPTAAKNLLGKAVWKATLTASGTDRQNHHRPRPHGSLLLFFFTDHSALFTISSPSSLRQPPSLGELWRSRGFDRQAGTAQGLAQGPTPKANF